MIHVWVCALAKGIAINFNMAQQLSACGWGMGRGMSLSCIPEKNLNKIGTIYALLAYFGVTRVLSGCSKPFYYFGGF